MPRTLDDDPEGQEEDDDFGAGEADYAPEADEAGELWCPKCGAVMYADASLCPAATGIPAASRTSRIESRSFSHCTGSSNQRRS